MWCGGSRCIVQVLVKSCQESYTHICIDRLCVNMCSLILLPHSAYSNESEIVWCVMAQGVSLKSS